MGKYKIDFEEGKIYHIYNRGNAGSLIFFKPKNYKYFLDLLDKYLSENLVVLTYCLLPNHFHLLIKVKCNINKSDTSKLISERFRRLFISYSQAINKQEKRYGSLFQKHFKRIEINKEDYLSRIILYIHLNPFKHGIASDYESYKYSAYQSLISDKPTKLMRDYVINWFGDKETFMNFHKQNKGLYELEKFDLN